MLFFYDDSPVACKSDDVVELSKLTLERVIGESGQPNNTTFGLLTWFDHGGRLFALKRDGQYVAFGWAMRSESFEVSEIGGIVRLRDTMLWIWNCITPAEYRGRGYYPALLLGIRHALHSPPTVIYCVAENIASRRGIEKAGFKRAFSVTEHRLFIFCRQTIRGLYGGYRRRRTGS